MYISIYSSRTKYNDKIRPFNNARHWSEKINIFTILAWLPCGGAWLPGGDLRVISRIFSAFHLYLLKRKTLYNLIPYFIILIVKFIISCELS